MALHHANHSSTSGSPTDGCPKDRHGVPILTDAWIRQKPARWWLDFDWWRVETEIRERRRRLMSIWKIEAEIDGILPSDHVYRALTGR